MIQGENVMSASTNFARVKYIESAANKSKAKYTELSNAIGTLASLGTTGKSSIVEAINEVAGKIGDNDELKKLTYAEVFPSSVSDLNPKFDRSDILNNSASYEGIHFILKGTNVTSIEGANKNSIITYSNGAWNVYVPKENDFILCNYKDHAIIQKFNGTDWEDFVDLSFSMPKKVLYVFEAGYGENLPATVVKGSKFLKIENGAYFVYDAIDDNTWDSGYPSLSKTVASGITNCFNFYGANCFKFTGTFGGMESCFNPYYDGALITAVGTDETYTYFEKGTLLSLNKNHSMNIRHVTDIITQVYDTVPSTSYAPAEKQILMINTSYKRIYTNTNSTNRWKSSSKENMPQNRSYLSLSDKRIFSNENDILKFAPLHDGEIFFYEGDKSYYIYRHSTQSFEKVGTTTATLTASMV